MSALLEARETPRRTVMLPADVLATSEWEKEVIMEKFWQRKERQSVTHPPLEVWDTCVPVPAPVGVELFIQLRKEKLRFFFLFCIFYFNEGNFI